MAKKYVRIGKRVIRIEEPETEKEKELKPVEHPKKKQIKPDDEKSLNQSPE